MSSGEEAKAKPYDQGASYDQYDEYGWFGYHGDEVGQQALNLLAMLLEPRSTEPSSEPGGWDNSDHATFNEFMLVTTGIAFIGADRKLEGGYHADVYRTFDRFHAALPFTQGERLWLFEPPVGRRAKPEALLSIETEIISAGVWQPLRGSDLVRRWWAWQRERDEFAGQGSLDVARQALGKMAMKLIKYDKWPDEHRDLYTLI